MKLNEDQEALIAHIQQAAKRYRDAKAHEYEIARQQAELRIHNHEVELQKAVALGSRAGIPFNQLAKRGMGVQNGTTARFAAEAGMAYLDELAEPSESDERQPERYTLDGDQLTVTFQPSDFEGKIADITEAQAIEFTIDADGNPIPSNGDYNHPAARLALTPDGRREIAAYLANHPF